MLLPIASCEEREGPGAMREEVQSAAGTLMRRDATRAQRRCNAKKVASNM